MTRFIDSFGRIISRDPNILESLQKNYQSSACLTFAQAGIEIESLQAAIIRLNEEIDFLRKKKVVAAVPTKIVTKVKKVVE